MHRPKFNGQIVRMNCIIGQVLCTHLLDYNQNNWPNYVAINEVAIGLTVNTSIKKALFEVLNDENIPSFPIDLLVSCLSSINPQAKTLIKRCTSWLKPFKIACLILKNH